MLNRVILSLLALLCLLALPAQAADQKGERLTLEHDDMQREYVLYAPATKSKAPRPLVVVLHREGDTPEQAAEKTGFSDLAEKAGFVVAYPVGSGYVPAWNAGKCCGYAERTQVDDSGFIAKMVKQIEAKTPINKNRIYATGLSSGGMMAYRLACDLSGTFAAVAPVAAAFNVTQCEASARPSLIIFHALDDQMIRYDGGTSAEGVRERLARSLAPDASVAQAMRFWKEKNYCRDFPAQETEDSYRKVTYFCAEGRHVELYSLNYGAHHWPKEAIDATAVIWEFFRNHPPRKLY